MTYPLIRKIGSYTTLSEDEKRRLHDALGDSIRIFEPRRDMLREGEKPDRIFVLIDGWAMRYKTLPDGRRQITSFLLPGDLCDSHMFVLAQMDHSIAALSHVTASELSRDMVLDLMERTPRLTQCLWWDTLVATSIQREWIVNIGRRDSAERMAHLLVELLVRMRIVGRASDGHFDMPATQGDLADALGITPVHTNRILQTLRTANLIQLDRKTLTILDEEGLKKLAGFNTSYLHLDREGQHLSANET